MTVVSLRCHECDEVKREKHVEMRGKGNNICDECKSSERDIPEAEDNPESSSGENGSQKTESTKSPDNDDSETDEEKEGGVSEETVEVESDNTPTESSDEDESDDDGERAKRALEQSFNEQDPLEW